MDKFLFNLLIYHESYDRHSEVMVIISMNLIGNSGMNDLFNRGDHHINPKDDRRRVYYAYRYVTVHFN